VPGYTRRQLKQDKFAETAQGAAEWATDHRRTVIWGAAALIAVVLIAIGIFTWHSRQIEQGNDALAAAMRTFDASLRAPGTPAPTDGPSYTSVAERAKAAEKQFKAVADKYSMVAPGKIAAYMDGVALLQAGEAAAGEQQLKKAADSGDKDVAALAKMALAGVYRNSNRTSDAAKLYKEIADHPTATVSKATAQLELAELYEKTDPQQASALYQQIQKDDPQSTAARVAAQKLSNKK
jgi:predicted negative regulator of RcsB-dependent stress response